MILQLLNFELKLRHTFRISREATNVQPTLIVTLEQDGYKGYGEATTNSYYGNTLESMHEEIETCRSFIEDYELYNPSTFYDKLMELDLSPASRCALDMAAHDLYGRIQGKPLYKLWGWDMQDYPITNYTIGIADPAEMVAKMKEKPWPVYKIKLGTSDDIALVQELRRHTNSVFRIDANCAWTVEQTIAYTPVLKDLGVEFIEQPLAADNWEGMEQVLHQSTLPVIADESCITEEDVAPCALHFHGINIKLVKCGGITPALRMMKIGKEAGLKLMVGCMTESSVGISAIAQLLPQLDYVDMDGAMLLEGDIAKGVQIGPNGRIILPERNGTGVVLSS